MSSTTVLHPPLTPGQRQTVAQALARGALMSYPTETSYALGGDALDVKLVEQIFALKGREEHKAILLLFDGARGLKGLAEGPSPAAAALMEAFWPGPLTLIFPAAPELPRHLTDGRGTVALRWSPNPVVAQLLTIGGVPLIGTSANLSGEAPARTMEAVLEGFGTSVSLAIDAGALAEGPPSTLVDTTARPFRVLRPGALPLARLQEVLAGFPDCVPREDPAERAGA